MKESMPAGVHLCGFFDFLIMEEPIQQRLPCKLGYPIFGAHAALWSSDRQHYAIVGSTFEKTIAFGYISYHQRSLSIFSPIIIQFLVVKPPIIIQFNLLSSSSHYFSSGFG